MISDKKSLADLAREVGFNCSSVWVLFIFFALMLDLLFKKFVRFFVHD